jgi:hypothetical protein
MVLYRFMKLFRFTKEKKLSLGVSIRLNVVSIETLDLDTGKKLVSTIEKSWLRSRNLDFVLTPASSPKSLDLRFLANLDSLSRSCKS